MSSDKALEAKLEASLLHDNTFSPRDDRRLRGKLMRESIPHSKHAGWTPPVGRPDPITVLESSNEGRLQELIPLRFGRMITSPFTFFRGSAALMAADLASTPNSGINVQACGDCHLLNFGAFATPERNIVFDLNDFDETLPAPWEWDLKRLATSFVLTARDNGLKDRFEVDAALAVARSYRERIAEYSKMPILDIWYHRIEWQSVIEKTSDEELEKRRRDRLKRAMKRTIADYYFPKMAQHFDGRYSIKDTPPTIYHPSSEGEQSLREQALEAFKDYRLTLQEDRKRLFDRYELKDVAIKVVGIGSVGTMCAVALLMAPDNEPLFLQFKEARPSVLEQYMGKSEFENHGQRVVAGQRVSQSASDIFLGWTKMANGKHFYIRQLRDTKIKLETETWGGPHLVEIAEVMGDVLARAHARTGDAAIIRGYLGSRDSFDQALAQFAVEYADQTAIDHALLVQAVQEGKIQVQLEELEDS